MHCRCNGLVKGIPERHNVSQTNFLGGNIRAKVIVHFGSTAQPHWRQVIMLCSAFAGLHSVNFTLPASTGDSGIAVVMVLSEGKFQFDYR